MTGFLGLAVFIGFYDFTNPEASVDIRVSRTKAEGIAESFIKERGLDLKGFDKTIVFSDCGETPIVYLQKSQGLKRANDLLRFEIPCWAWEIQYFKELNKERFFVHVTPSNGKVTYFDHALMEDDPGGRLTQGEARKIAEDILILQGEILEEYELKSFSTDERKNRTDHHFEWEKKGYKIADGTMRIAVSIDGDKLGYYGKYFHIPEQFERDFTKEKTPGYILSFVFGSFIFLLVIAAIFILIVQYKNSRIRWSLAFWFSIIFIPLNLLSFFNDLPILWSNYIDTLSKNVFLGISFGGVLVGTLFGGLLIFLFCASGESLSYDLKHNCLPIINAFKERTLRLQDLSLRIMIGYSLGLFGLGYVTIFYLIAENYLHVWKPLSPDYSNMLGTSMPFLYPLTIASFAAISEEFMDRMFAISFFKKYFKRTWLAILIPAILWGFAHSGYAIYPMYVRGIELTIVGIIWGMIYLKYGVETVIIAHYVYNAVMIGLPLLRSQNYYYLISGLIVIVLLLIPVLILPLLIKIPKKESSSPL